MSKYRPGFYPNSNLSALNKDDSVINSSKLFDGCIFIFYTSSDSSSLNALTLNTSDATEPKLIKQKITEDKKDDFAFKVIASGDGYLFQSNKTQLYLVPASSKSVYGSKTKSGVWKFANVGGTTSLTCKLKSTTISNSGMFLTEAKDGDIVMSDKGDAEFSIGVITLGKNAFAACLPTDPHSQKSCCSGTISTTNYKYPICVDKKFTPGSSSCPKAAPGFDFMFADIKSIATGGTPAVVKSVSYTCAIILAIVAVVILCMFFSHMHRGGGRRRSRR